MISIIICSRSSDIPSSFRKNIELTIGVNYEIIVIDNSKNEYSIFSAYNQGVGRSLYPYLCFVHDDIMFRTDNWGKKLIRHLNDQETGIIGIAGGKIMAKVPAQWSSEGKYKNIIQHRKNKIYRGKEPGDFSGIRQSVILLDGVFLSMRRNFFDEISFDEKIEGFHGYDHDICAQSIVSGFKNYVVYDILLEHFSAGKGDARFYNNLITISKKWEKHLPLFSNDSKEEIRRDIDNIELRRLSNLIRELTITGFSKKSIIMHAQYFANKLGTEEAKDQLKHIGLKIFLLRLTQNPKYLFSKTGF